MPLFAEPASTAGENTRRRASLRTFETWNRRLHYYLGLYFLFLIWLFSFTGLLLNHPGWARHAADRRSEQRYERAVDVPGGGSAQEQARDLMRQLGIEGEIDWPTGAPPGRFDFNVSRPNEAAQVRVDLKASTATVQTFQNTGFATFRILHTFNGSRFNAPTMTRDWTVTTVWTFLMDAFAAGLVVMVVGSYYMWYRLKRTHSLGLVMLSGGCLSCALFLAGLLWPELLP